MTAGFDESKPAIRSLSGRIHFAVPKTLGDRENRTKKVCEAPLKLIPVFLTGFLPLLAVPGASFGSGRLNRAPDGVQRSFVSILLLGGLGYEDLRS